MSHAHSLVENYFRRTGRPGDQALDAAYQFEVAVLRDMLDRLEAILDDEGVPRDVVMRVLRCLLYGAPSPAAAEMRMQQQEQEMVKLMERLPVSLDGLGLPPKVSP